MLVHEAIEQAIAEEFVRLQGSTLQQLFDAAQLQQQGLGAAISPIAQQAYDSWRASGDRTAHFLYVTLRVSQNRTLESVLAQPDVQAAMRQPFDSATDHTRDAIAEAWQEGAARGHEAANQDLAIAGLEPTGPCPIDPDVLNRLLDDAAANGEAAYQRFRGSITSMDPDAVRGAIRNVAQDQALRARHGADVAGRHAFTAAKLCTYEQAPEEEQQDPELQGVTLYKVWVTSFSANTCAACAALHGTRLGVDQYFPADATFGRVLPAWGTLQGPPRHPNCRCQIVLHRGSFEDEEGPTVRSMREFAEAWWESRGTIGLTRVVVPPHPRMLSTGKITMVEGYSYDRASAALDEAITAIGGIKGPSYTEELATKHIPASIAKGDALPTAMRVWRSDFINSTNMRAIAEGRKPAPAYERDLQLHFWALLLRDAVRDGEPLGHDTWRLESAMPPAVGDPVETTMRAVAKERSEAEGYLPTLLEQKHTVLYHFPPEAKGVWYDDGREGIISGRFVVTSVRQEGDTWIAEVGPPKPPGRAGWARALGGVPTPTTEYRDEAHKRQAQGLKYAADTLETTPAKLKAKADKRVAEAIKGTHVAVRVDSSQLEQILDDGKLINRFQGAEAESGTRSDAGPWRELWEEAAFGLDPETPAEARPVYGYLAKDVATTQLKLGTPQGIGRYGDIAIRLKDEVRGRTSFTTDDSGAQNASTYEPGITDSELMPESIPQPVLAPSSEAFDWANERHYYETEEHDEGVGGYTESHMETPLDYPDADEMLRGGGYYEAQVHGGVDLSDIEEVVFTVDVSTVEWNKTVEKLKRHLDALGIKWREQFQARLEPTEQRAEGGRTADYVFDYEPTPPPGRA